MYIFGRPMSTPARGYAIRFLLIPMKKTTLALFAIALASNRVNADPVLPDFSSDNFTAGAPIDSPFFPLVPGAWWWRRGRCLGSWRRSPR